MADFIQIISATDAALRNQSLESACRDLSAGALAEQCAGLDAFRRTSENLYERVRALFFLYAIHRFHLPPKLAATSGPGRGSSQALILFQGYEHLLHRRFEEAIDQFLAVQQREGPGDALSSA